MHVFSSSTRNFIGLLVKFIQDALCIIRDSKYGTTNVLFVSTYSAKTAENHVLFSKYYDKYIVARNSMHACNCELNYISSGDFNLHMVKNPII